MSRYMEFCVFAIRWLNLPRTPSRWPVNWFNSSLEIKLRVGVFDRARISRPRAVLPIVLVSIGPDLWLVLWMMVSSPPVITESWVSSVMIGDRNVSGRRYIEEYLCA